MTSASKEVRMTANQYQQCDRFHSMEAGDFIVDRRQIEYRLYISGETEAIQNRIFPFFHICHKYEYHKGYKKSNDSEP